LFCPEQGNISNPSFVLFALLLLPSGSNVDFLVDILMRYFQVTMTLGLCCLREEEQHHLRVEEQRERQEEREFYEERTGKTSLADFVELRCCALALDAI
jgi:hypothetical protein